MLKSIFFSFIFLNIFFFLPHEAAADGVNILGYAQVDYLSSSSPEAEYGFQIRRFNLIFDENSSSKVRVLGDVEFEDGTDYSSANQKGAVKISRLFWEYQINKKLKLRTGKTLTPFGLYNELHDFSSAYQTIDVPHFYMDQPLRSGQVANRFFSKYSTGISIIGEFLDEVKRSNILEYNIFLSNGRDETSSGTDSDRRSAVGARLIYKFGEAGSWQAGASIYNESVIQGIDGVANSRQQAIGVDLQNEGSIFLFQIEILRFQFEKSISGIAQARWVDDAYVHLGYNISPENTLYFHYELEKLNQNTTEYLTDSRIGIMHTLTPKITLKAEFDDIRNDPSSSVSSYYNYRLSSAMTF